jgi:hypothetical protein
MSTSLHASSEPEPPNVTIVKSRMSRPRWTVTRRSAFAWFHAETSRTPVAQLSRDSPSVAARTSMPSAARSAWSGTSPPSRCGGIRPSNRCASVTVGASPPVS